MWRLILVSVVWALSFGLIKGQLTGLDSGLVASLRLILCFLCFLPFFIKVQGGRIRLQLMALGAIQFGFMYLAYIKSYQYLPGYLVAVFTIFTPVYVVLLDAVWGSRKKILLALSSAALSVVGAAIIVFKVPQQEGYLLGLLILQLANIAFAFGQWQYQRWAPTDSQAGNMFWMYFGGALLASLVSFPTVKWQDVSISLQQWQALLYLGTVASGLCFYLWNSGAKQVSVPTLAAMNNGYIPFAVIFSVVIWQEQTDWLRLIPGAVVLLLALWVAYKAQASDIRADELSTKCK